MELLVGVLSGGVGVAVGAIFSVVVGLRELRRSRISTTARLDQIEQTMRTTTDARLDRIEHLLSAPDQAWYWTPEWQEGEVAADADLADGRSKVHLTEADLMEAIDSIPASDEASRTSH
jgi:hypothetical protein